MFALGEGKQQFEIWAGNNELPPYVTAELTRGTTNGASPPVGEEDDDVAEPTHRPPMVAAFDVRVSCKYENIFMPAQKQPEAIALGTGSTKARYYYWGSDFKPPLSAYSDDRLLSTEALSSPLVSDAELQTYFEDYFAYNIEFAEKLRAACANQRSLVRVISQGVMDFYNQKSRHYLVADDYKDLEAMLIQQGRVPRLWAAATADGELLDEVYAFICHHDSNTRLLKNGDFANFAPHTAAKDQVVTPTNPARPSIRKTKLKQH